MTREQFDDIKNSLTEALVEASEHVGLDRMGIMNYGLQGLLALMELEDGLLEN